MPASHFAAPVAGRAWWSSPRQATMSRSATSFMPKPTYSMWRSPHGQTLLQQPPRPLGQVGSRSRRLVVAAARDPYDLLGVPRTATMDEIKRAYRKKALKLHPDVNKAPDAKERFMECKNAYQQLLDAKQGRGGGAGGSSAGAAGGWGSAWGGSQGYGSSRTSGAGRGGAPPPPEETYSFGELFDLAVGLGRSARSAFNKGVEYVEDMLRDLEKEFSEYSKEKQSKAGGSGSSEGGRMKSLWEELADIGKDIGEELVEFLEQELGLSDDDGAGSKQRSSSASSSSSSSTASSGGSSTSSQQRQQAPPPPPPPKKSSAEEVEDELEALKRKLGMK